MDNNRPINVIVEVPKPLKERILDAIQEGLKVGTHKILEELSRSFDPSGSPQNKFEANFEINVPTLHKTEQDNIDDEIIDAEFDNRD